MQRLSPLHAFTTWRPTGKRYKKKKMSSGGSMKKSPLLKSKSAKTPSARTTGKGGLQSAINAVKNYAKKQFQYNHYMVQMREAIMEHKKTALKSMEQAGSRVTQINKMLEEIGTEAFTNYLSNQVYNKFGQGQGGVLHSTTRHENEDGESGVRDNYVAQSSEMMAGKEIQHIGFRHVIRAVKDRSMLAASKLYPAQKLIVSEYNRKVRGQLYFQSSFNCKSIAYFGPGFVKLATTDANPKPLIQVEDPGLYPLGFLTSDYYNVWGSMNNFDSIPSLFTGVNASAVTDLYLPLESMHLVTNIYNSNTYYSANIKIYLLRAKINCTNSGSNTAAGGPPPRSWLGSYGASGTSSFSQTQSANAMWKNWYLYDNYPEINENSYQNEASMYVQCTPSMSEKFQYTWDIIDVKTCQLPAASTLTYHLEKQFSRPMSYREIENRRKQDIAVYAGDYTIMIEHQTTQEGIVNPDSCSDLRDQNSPTQYNNPIVGIPPSRVRIDFVKYAYVDTTAVNKVVSPSLTPDQVKVESLDTNQTSWLYQKNIAPSIDMEQPTLPYSNYVKTPSTGRFTAPVYTDQFLQEGGPVTKDS